MASIGEQIKGARKAKGMTQEMLAAQVNLTRQAVSHWESGRTVPDAEMLLKLSVLLDVRFENALPVSIPSYSSAETPIPSVSESTLDACPAAEPPETENDISLSLRREIRKNHILWFVLISVLLVVCLVSLGFFLQSRKSSDIHMEILEPEVFLREDTQLLGDIPGWEFTLSVENRSDVAFTPDRITVLVYKNDELTDQRYIGYSELQEWMDSDKLRKNETPLHWLFAIREADITHVELFLKGRDDMGHILEKRLTVLLHRTND